MKIFPYDLHAKHGEMLAVQMSTSGHGSDKI